MSAVRVEIAGVELGVELGAVQDAERDEIEPEQKRDAGAQ
jgi:hypothetical protein